MSKANPHKRFCDYEIAKANKRKVITQRKAVVQGIKTSGKSKAMLALELASLFQKGEQK